jgi:hypothetical protein
MIPAKVRKILKGDFERNPRLERSLNFAVEEVKAKVCGPWDTGNIERAVDNWNDNVVFQHGLPYYLSYRTMVLRPVRTYSDMIEPGLVLKGGLVTR